MEFHADKATIGASIEVVEHDTSEGAILHLENDVVGYVAVAAATQNEINVGIVDEHGTLHYRRRCLIQSQTIAPHIARVVVAVVTDYRINNPASTTHPR